MGSDAFAENADDDPRDPDIDAASPPERGLSALDDIPSPASSSRRRRRCGGGTSPHPSTMGGGTSPDPSTIPHQASLNLVAPARPLPLPHCVIAHLFGFLDAHSVDECALVDSKMRSASRENRLWKRLFERRFEDEEVRRVAGTAAKGGVEWRALYCVQHNGTPLEWLEFEAIKLAGTVPAMASPPRSPTDPVSTNGILRSSEIELAIRVARSRFGASWAPSRESRSESHTCSGLRCRLAMVNDCFVCFDTGQVHVCRGACEVDVAPETGALVCRVSGRVFDRAPIHSPAGSRPDVVALRRVSS